MQSRAIRVGQFDYKESTWTGEDESGLQPLNDNISVMVDLAPDKTLGGVMITEDQQLKLQMAAETGILVAMGDGAFLYSADRVRGWTGGRPKPGDRIVFERYSGSQHVGKDKKQYRLMSDRCVCAIFKGD